MWYAHDVGWGWWLLMSLGMVAFWGVVIYGVIWLVRGSTAESKPTSPEPPLAVLKRRLGAGEISVEEYEQLREALGDDDRHAVGV
jgi:putative membrane protein